MAENQELNMTNDSSNGHDNSGNLQTDGPTPSRPPESLSSQEKQVIAHVRQAVEEHIELEESVAADDPAIRLAKFLKFMVDEPGIAQLKYLAEQQQRELDLFQVLRVQDSELVHSNFLAWLLDPEGTHAIGSNFLRGFLECSIRAAHERDIRVVPNDTINSIDWSGTEVLREWQFIDILVLNRKARFACAIENKIWADEGFSHNGQSQLTTYRRLLEKEFPEFDRHLVFLSPCGMASASGAERKYWVPENYATVHKLIEECRQNFANEISPEVSMFLKQYETTLRRNVVPETSEIGKIAGKIYLEHRDAIELIYRHRPDYRAGIKQTLTDAIEEQSGWVISPDSPDYVRFRSCEWDSFAAQKTGTGWAPRSNDLLLFEFWCPAEPTSTRGPSLTLGPGTNEALRRHIYEQVSQNPGAFKVRGSALSEGYTYLHEFRLDLLEDGDLGIRWDDGSARNKLREWVKRFAEDEFPRINAAVVRCLQEYQAGDVKPPDRNTSLDAQQSC